MTSPMSRGLLPAENATFLCFLGISFLVEMTSPMSRGLLRVLGSERAAFPNLVEMTSPMSRGLLRVETRLVGHLDGTAWK